MDLYLTLYLDQNRLGAYKIWVKTGASKAKSKLAHVQSSRHFSIYSIIEYTEDALRWLSNTTVSVLWNWGHINNVVWSVFSVPSDQFPVHTAGFLLICQCMHPFQSHAKTQTRNKVVPAWAGLMSHSRVAYWILAHLWSSLISSPEKQNHADLSSSPQHSYLNKTIHSTWI